MTIITDEHQELWDVRKGDPSWTYCQHLTKVGYPNIRLPLTMVMGVDIPTPDVNGLNSLDGEDFLHMVSLLDQVEACVSIKEEEADSID